MTARLDQEKPVLDIFTVAIVKGLKERDDAGHHMNSAVGFQRHLNTAFVLGLIDRRAKQLTALGLTVYAAAGLADLPMGHVTAWGDCRKVVDQARTALGRGQTDQPAPPQKDGESGPTMGADYLIPDWSGAHRAHDWRNHINAELRQMWSGFTAAQRRAIARNAQESADREDWD